MRPLSLGRGWGGEGEYDFVISKSYTVESLDVLYLCTCRLKLDAVVLLEIQVAWCGYALSTGICLPTFRKILVSSIDMARHLTRTEF